MLAGSSSSANNFEEGPARTETLGPLTFVNLNFLKYRILRKS